jgi:RNA polymerase sigma-70 factor, ECF subfamily
LNNDKFPDIPLIPQLNVNGIGPNPVLGCGGRRESMAGIPRPVEFSNFSPNGVTTDDGRDARFTDLVKRHSLFVYRVAFSVLRNASDAEEVVQDTFLRIYRADATDRMQNQRAFLARTAWRIAIDRRPANLTILPSDNIATRLPSPEDAAIGEDWNAAIHRLIDALPDHLRLPLVLSTVEELTSPEIAQVMGIAEGTVRTRLMRARQILREKLEALMEGKK